MNTHAISVDEKAVDPNTGNVVSGYYKSYVALITQENQDAPVATVLNAADSNFVGNIVWTREVEGLYIGELSGAFPLAKTFIMCMSTGSTVMVSAGNNEEGSPSSQVYIRTESGDVHVDGQMYNFPLEIRVYQN